jgi:hypothetical protein
MDLEGKYCVKALEINRLPESERSSCSGVLVTLTETTLLLDHKPDKKLLKGRYLIEGGCIPAEKSVFSLLKAGQDVRDS